jgi:hypothetical protein
MLHEFNRALARLHGFAGSSRARIKQINGLIQKVFTTALVFSAIGTCTSIISLFLSRAAPPATHNESKRIRARKGIE